jgi:hypothetical protein
VTNKPHLIGKESCGGKAHRLLFLGEKLTIGAALASYPDAVCEAECFNLSEMFYTKLIRRFMSYE